MQTGYATSGDAALATGVSFDAVGRCELAGAGGRVAGAILGAEFPASVGTY